MKHHKSNHKPEEKQRPSHKKGKKRYSDRKRISKPKYIPKTRMPKKHVQKSSIEEISAESSTREDLKQDLLLKYQTIKKSEPVKFVKKGLSSLLKFAESYHPDDPTNLKRTPGISNSKKNSDNPQNDPLSEDNPFTGYGNTFKQSTSKSKKSKKQEPFDMFNNLL